MVQCELPEGWSGSMLNSQMVVSCYLSPLSASAVRPHYIPLIECSDISNQSELLNSLLLAISTSVIFPPYVLLILV